MEIINRLLEISVYSVILFMAILVFKKTFKHKMSPALHFTVWFLLIARLCIPVTIDSGLKLVVIPEQTSAEIAQAAPTSGQETPFFETKNDANTLNISQLQQAAVSNVVKPKAAENTNVLIKLIAAIKWTDIFIAVWLIGILLRAGWMASTACKMKRIILRHGLKPTLHTHELLNKCKTELGIRKDIPVYLLPNISTPALTIGFRPKIVLPLDITKTLSDEQLCFAIKHELMHFKRNDNIVCLLLRALEAVYWFNPLVWLMGRCVVADMETACDSMVGKTLDKQGKKKYVLTLLDMFSQKQSRLMLGMAICNTEKVAEKRIRGVYMKSKSNRSVRFIAGVLAAALFVLCFTTACQPTPEKSVIVGKNNNDLDSIIGSTPAPTIDMLSTQNETWQEQLSGNNVTINIDAEIAFPQVAQLPVVEIEPLTYTEEDAWKAIKVFFQDSTVYDEPLLTKEVLEAQIITLKKELANIKSGAIDGEVESINKEIEYYSMLLQTAPSENDDIQVLTDLSFKEKNESEIINVYAYIKNKSYPSTLMVSRNASEYNSGIYLSNRADDISTTPITENNMETTLDEAVSLAQSTMSELGIEDMILAGSSIEGSKEEQGYVLKFIKSVNGIGISYYQTRMMTQAEGEASIVAPFLRPEQVTVYINDSGILKFVQTNALEIGDVINGNVNVMSIDEIKDVFKNQIFYNYYAPDDHPLTINIDLIELGYFIQIVKEQQGVFRAIPVWDFLAREVMYEGDSYTYSVLTINAIDGSIINRDLGY